MGFEPEYNPKNKLKIECPLRFTVPEIGTECITDKCAWWMINQRACAINVLARISGYIKGKFEIPLKGNHVER